MTDSKFTFSNGPVPAEPTLEAMRAAARQLQPIGDELRDLLNQVRRAVVECARQYRDAEKAYVIARQRFGDRPGPVHLDAMTAASARVTELRTQLDELLTRVPS